MEDALLFVMLLASIVTLLSVFLVGPDERLASVVFGMLLLFMTLGFASTALGWNDAAIAEKASDRIERLKAWRKLAPRVREYEGAGRR